MRRLLGTLAALVIIGSPLAVAIPAQASGLFDMQDINAASSAFRWWIDDSQGAGHQLLVDPASATDFQLVNENIIHGVVTWEIADGIGCMNATDSTGVYINSCIPGDSNEEWISTGSTHYWENVHRGQAGFLNVDCNTFMGSCQGVVSVTTAEPWATPGS